MIMLTTLIDNPSCPIIEVTVNPSKSHIIGSDQTVAGECQKKENLCILFGSESLQASACIDDLSVKIRTFPSWTACRW